MRELGWTLRYPSWRQGFVAAYAQPAAAPRRHDLFVPVPTGSSRDRDDPQRHTSPREHDDDAADRPVETGR
jgi:hypothetical protein